MSDSKTLAHILRPKSFDRVVGQETTVEAIRKQIASGRVSPAWIFSGFSGYGKTTMAQILGKALCCLDLQHKSVLFGSLCSQCFGQQYSISEINASEVKGIDAIGDLARNSLFAPPVGSPRRVLILNEAQGLTAPSQELLLDYFENAPATTTWIITTTEVSKIRPALRKRCIAYQLEPLNETGIKLLLKRAATHASYDGDLTKLADVLDRHSIASPRDVLMVCEKVFSGMSPSKAVSGSETGIDTMKICRALLDKNWDVVRGQLKKAKAEEATAIRVAILGYMRSVVLGSDEGASTGKQAARIISALNTGVPFEAAFTIYWLTGVLFTLSSS